VGLVENAGSRQAEAAKRHSQATGRCLSQSGGAQKLSNHGAERRWLGLQKNTLEGTDLVMAASMDAHRLKLAAIALDCKTRFR